jgi:NADH-dependent peroxiredoxin subunit F
VSGAGVAVHCRSYVSALAETPMRVETWSAALSQADDTRQLIVSFYFIHGEPLMTLLDESLIEQLKTHFAGLEHTYTFAVAASDHERQSELLELVNGVASASDKLTVAMTSDRAAAVQFELHKDGKRTGVSFRGIPGGHEFTSLVLSVLNADGKGRLPDSGIVARVQRLRGPVKLRTYISLSCTNCPDVVQALNQIALLHPEIEHEMVDGGLAEAEVAELGIQAVPSVYAGSHLLHVGKASFAELLEALEQHLGVSEGVELAAPSAPKDYDIIVIGGGPAGASAAIYSARKGLSTALVSQKFGGQVQDTLGIENLISVKYTEGPKLSADLNEHVRSYPVEILDHRKVEKIVDGEQKEVHLAGGEILRSSKLILATGAKWRELGIPGEKQYIGKGVAFCPHCDGPFYKGRRVAVVGGGNSGVEAAIDLAGICSHVTLFEFLDELKADAVLVKNLKALPNVDILTKVRTTEVVGNGSQVTAIRYQDRDTEVTQELALDGVFVQIGLVPNSAFVKDWVATNRFGEIIIDDRGRTNVPGVYAAGDVTTVPFKQIIVAMGEGAKAALTAFEDRIRAE